VRNNFGMASKALAVPEPGQALVPSGWWEEVVVPWADEQTNGAALHEAAAQLTGLEAAYRQLGLDTVELTRAHRFLEIRIGELLPREQGRRTDLELRPSVGEVERHDRERFRKLAEARPQLVEVLRETTDPDALTRAALLRIARQASPPKRRGPRPHPMEVERRERARIRNEYRDRLRAVAKETRWLGRNIERAIANAPDNELDRWLVVVEETLAHLQAVEIAIRHTGSSHAA
jgi:hypothetical protein